MGVRIIMSNDIDTGIAEEFQGDWMRIPFAAEYLKIHESTLYKQVDKGKLTVLVVSPTLKLVSRKEILNWQAGKKGRPRKRREGDEKPTD